ncbi:SLOG family protein [Chryseobacterium phage MA9V-2]|nr:SLOG family protein [Chryseobacterium phage MA9V-2]
MSEQYKVICGTGHRPDKLGGYDNQAAHNNLVHLLIDALRELRPELVIVGMAQGFDQALAEAAYELDIPFIAALPCKGQELRWPTKAQQHYNYLLSLAKAVTIVNEGDYKPWFMQTRNKFMVDNSQATLTVWDGTPGGTYNTIEYTKQNEKPIINLYDKWKTKYN